MAKEVFLAESEELGAFVCFGPQSGRHKTEESFRASSQPLSSLVTNELADGRIM